MTASSRPAAARRAWRRVERLAYWVVLPVACLVLLGAGANTLAGHLDDVPAGVQGTFTVTMHLCRDRICVTGGVFTSADSSLRETDLLGDYRWHVGEQHPAVYQPSAIDVIPLPARWDPTTTVSGIVGALLFLGAWAWVLVTGRRPRRLAAG